MQRSIFLALWSVFVVIAAPLHAQESKELTATLDRFTTRFLQESPELATSLAVSEVVAGGKYAHRLSDRSTVGLAREATLARNMRADLGRIDRASLPAADAVTYDVVATFLDNVIASARFEIGSYGMQLLSPYVVTQLDGAYVGIPDFLDSQHQVKTEQDAEDYLARLRAYETLLDQETARIASDARKGVVPPDFAIDGALKQLQDFASQRPADTVLVKALQRKMAEAKLPAAKQQQHAAQAENIVKERVLPAYTRQIAQLSSVRAAAVHDAGIWRIPRGSEYYAAALRAFNTTTLSPDEIHEMGRQLIETIHREMDMILDSQGLKQGSVAERVQKLSADPSQLYPNTDPGREQLLQALNQQVDALESLLPRFFGQLARAKLEIRRVPPYIEAGAPGGYYQSPALDGSRPGYYYINLRDTAEWPKFTLPTLTYHEGVPGHHWQRTIAQETSGLPMIRGAILGFAGYTEGWALYSEQLADELGVYAQSPLGRLGYLQSMAFRACRLVVDTGLHHKRWSREQAIDYMVEITGDQRASVTTEVERYAVWPGQATAYMVGRETINRLRARAREQLGERFDLREFHDVVLRNSSMPLSVLDTVVKDWIAVTGSRGG